jgi:hypothetical protein
MYGSNFAQAAPRGNHFGDNLVGVLRRSASLQQNCERQNQQRKYK